jgi:hypothetical protein
LKFEINLSESMLCGAVHGIAVIAQSDSFRGIDQDLAPDGEDGVVEFQGAKICRHWLILAEIRRLERLRVGALHAELGRNGAAPLQEERGGA